MSPSPSRRIRWGFEGLAVIWIISSAAVGAAQEPPPRLAVEAVHTDEAGGTSNVNGFYSAAFKHHVPSVHANYAVGGATYNHRLAIMDTSGVANNATVRYYGPSALVAQKTYSVPAYGFVTAGGDVALPQNFSGSAVVTTSGKSVVEVDIRNTNHQHRSYRATPDSARSKTLYLPIAYDRVFLTQSSAVMVQNADQANIPAGGITVSVTCQDNEVSHTFSNSGVVKPGRAVTIPLQIPDELLREFQLPNGQPYFGFCDNSAALLSVLFGHGRVDSPYWLAGSQVITDTANNAQRHEEVNGRLSTTLYVPSVMWGSWQGGSYGSSLNISNPQGSPANVLVDVFRRAGGLYSLFETRRPQGPGALSCNGTMPDPIPAEGERSFIYRTNLASDTCNGGNFGTGEDAFAFDVIHSDVPVSVSYNKTRGSDNFAELALAEEEIKSTIYVPQVYVGAVLPEGTFTTRVNVLNTGDIGYNYRFEYFNALGTLVHSEVNYIAGKQLFADELSSLPSNSVYSLKISPVN